MIEIKVESSEGKIIDMWFLLEQHWEEVAKNKAIMKLKPLTNAYEILEEYGALLCLFAYDDGELVGYSVNIVAPHLHYADLIYCNNDVLYLHPSKRNSTLGLRLMAETEKEAKNRGAQLMLWHAKEQSALDKILARKKYKVQDIIYAKEL